MIPRTAILALVAAASASACADEPPPPDNLVFVRYEGYDTASVLNELSIDVAQDRVTFTRTTAFTATLTADAHFQIDVGVQQVEDTWDPAEPCEACRLFPESFHFSSDQGPVSVSFGHVGDGTNVDQLGLVVDELILELSDCHGGNLVEQCFQQP